MTQGKENTKMNWKDWLITILIAAIAIPALIYFSKHEEKRLIEVTTQDGNYNLYNQGGDCLKGLSKDSLDKVLMYEYQIGVK
jgi:uncharacterized membrane protein YukC